MFNDSVPDCGRLLYSKADHPNKCKYKRIKSGSSVSNNASAIEVQPTVVPDVTTTEVNQCVTKKGQEKIKPMQCPAQDDIVLQDRKCQKIKKCTHASTIAQRSYIAVKKTSNQVQERAPKGSKCYAATQASYNS